MTTKTTETGSPRDSGANYDEMRDRISDIRNVDLYPSDMSRAQLHIEYCVRVSKLVSEVGSDEVARHIPLHIRFSDWEMEKSDKDLNYILAFRNYCNEWVFDIDEAIETCEFSDIALLEVEKIRVKLLNARVLANDYIFKNSKSFEVLPGERARELIIGIISGIECYVQVLSESDDDIGNRIITAFDEANGTYILECFIKDRQNLKSILHMIGGTGTDKRKSMRSGDFRDDLMSESDFTALVKRVKKGSEQYEYDPDKEIM